MRSMDGDTVNGNPSIGYGLETGHFSVDDCVSEDGMDTPFFQLQRCPANGSFLGWKTGRLSVGWNQDADD